MGQEIYSKLGSIPTGYAPDRIVEGCLVLEGGAFRGMYTQGALDAWMQRGLNFQCTLGVSAGALAGVSYVSGQIGRSARANLGHRHDKAYIGTDALRKSKSLIRLDFLLNDYNAIEPLDEARFHDPRRRFLAEATDCRTGEAVFWERGQCDIFSAAKASASMPFVTPMVNVDGVPCLDGGCSCGIPFDWALSQGYEKIVVIRTRHRGYRKPPKERATAEAVYRNSPGTWTGSPRFTMACVTAWTPWNSRAGSLSWLRKSPSGYPGWRETWKSWAPSTGRATPRD